MFCVLSQFLRYANSKCSLFSAWQQGAQKHNFGIHYKLRIRLNESFHVLLAVSFSQTLSTLVLCIKS